MQPCEVGERLTEDSPTRGEWAYPASKLAAEEVIRDMRDGIPVVVLRIAGVYDDECHSIPLARQIARIHERQMESFVFPGDSHAGNAYLHIDDLAECVRLLIEKRRQLAEEELFLVAEPEVLSYAELQEKFGELIHGEAWPSIRIPKFVAKAGAWAKEKLAREDHAEPFIKPWMIDLADDHYAVDISRLKRKLQWEPKRRLAHRLKHMVASLQANPQRWYRRQGLPVEEVLSASAD
jgi:nucleoside-diphosphate-sugar epimerase